VAGAKVKGSVAVPQASLPDDYGEFGGCARIVPLCCVGTPRRVDRQKTKKAAEGCLQPEDSGVMAGPETET